MAKDVATSVDELHSRVEEHMGWIEQVEQLYQVHNVARCVKLDELKVKLIQGACCYAQ